MTRKTIPLWFTVVAFLLLLAAAGVAIYRQAHTISGQASQLSERAKENDALRRQLRELSATPTAPAASEPAPAPSSTMPRPPRSAPEALAVA
jgi:hypothetical protein